MATDQDRSYARELVASDASPSVGFGVVPARCTSELSRTVGNLAERRGDFVRLFPEAGDPRRRDRIGRPFHLGLSKKSLRLIICKKAKWMAHSSVLEAHGYLLAVRWSVRTKRLHHTRSPYLLDAKAILAAAAKGRSSARAIARNFRCTGALQLAANILPRHVYVPSEDMSADEPSRGIRHRRQPVGA